jgi:xylan 1,4-beta-xylosidase
MIRVAEANHAGSVSEMKISTSAALVCLMLGRLAIAQTPPAPVRIAIDAGSTVARWSPIWRFFGYDEANFTYMKDGRPLLAELGKLRTAGEAPVYVRCHDLLTSGDAVPGLKWSSTNVYTQDADGKPVYDWTIVDRIFDTYKKTGCKPYVEIGFMPEALSTHPQDYPHDPPRETPLNPKAGMAYPPKDYSIWRELVRRWVAHCVDRYGKAEVETWYWEVWNEPNIDYWQGTPADYFKLYDFTIDGVRSALPTARVGGPETAGGPGGNFLRDFLIHCDAGINAATGAAGAPLDFVSFHAKGRPKFIDGHVRMGMAAELKDAAGAMKVIAASAKFHQLPIVIGECDPEGCAACRGPQNGYRNGTMYSSYTAASFPKIVELADEYHVRLDGALTWAFEFEDEPYFAGFRALSTNGIDLPVLNTFRAMSELHGDRVTVTSASAVSPRDVMSKGVPAGQADVSAVATWDGTKLAAMVWDYADDDIARPGADVTLDLTGLKLPDGPAAVEIRRIDSDHGDAYTAWKKMGSPDKPTAEQIAALQKAATMTTETAGTTVTGGRAKVGLTVPAEGVALVVIRRSAR